MSNTQKYIIRLHRIEGQLRGVEKMFEQERSIIPTIQQLDAAKSSLAKLISHLLIEEVLNVGEQIQKNPNEGMGYLKKYLEK